MNLEVVTKHITGEEAVRSYIASKVETAFDRFEHRIDSLTIRLSDESAGSNTFSGLCKIEALLIPRQHIHVDANGQSPFECIGNAIDKMVAALKHDFDRTRHSTNIRHEQSRAANRAQQTTPD